MRCELGDPELALSGTGDEGARRLGEYVLDGEEGLEGDEELPGASGSKVTESVMRWTECARAPQLDWRNSQE
jgi:hypothetical protein